MRITGAFPQEGRPVRRIAAGEMTMHVLEQKIRDANKQGRPALIPFVTAGFPNADDFWPVIKDLDDSGADIIEIGVPFSDPVADGPVVEEASRRALSDGMTLRKLMADLKDRGGFFKAGLVLMGYYNPFLQYGLEKLAADAKAAHVSGLIIPDLPYEESGEVRALFRSHGLALIALVGLNTSAERMALYASDAEGYVYVISSMGTTGVREHIAPEVDETMIRARKAFSLPLALGFGLKEPAQIEILHKDARPDAVVFGSALLQHLDAGLPAAEFLRHWL